MAEIQSLLRLFLDPGTQNLSTDHIHHPDRYYEPRVQAHADIDRSIPVFGGLVQTGEMTVRLKDNDRQVRAWWAAKTLRRRMGELKFGEVGTSEAAFKIPYTGEVITGRFGPSDAELVIRDTHYRWLDKPVPTLGNRENFPNMREGLDEWFIPIIFGQVTGFHESPVNEVGVLPVEFMDVTNNGYVCARHTCAVIELYRKNPGASEFSPVLEVEYTKQVIPQTIDGITYDIQWIFFNSAQDPAAEFKANIEGIFSRPAFGDSVDGLSAIVDAVPRTIVDHLLNFILHIQRLMRTDADFNIPAWVDAFDLSIALDLALDYAVVKIGTTPRVVISQLTGSVGADLFTDKFAKLTLALTFGRGLESTDPVFDDDHHFHDSGVRLSLPSKTINRVFARYALDYTTGQTGRELVMDNVTDQANLQIEEESSGYIEDATVDLPAIRLQSVAETVMEEFLAWHAQDAYEADFSMDAFENIDDVELAQVFGMTHFEGITEDPDGWVAEPFKIFGLRSTLDENRVLVRAKRRGTVNIVRVIESLSIPVDLLEGEIEPDDTLDISWGGTGVQIDPATNYPEAAVAKYENSFQRDDGVDTHEFQDDGFGSNSFPPPPPSVFEYQTREEVEITLGGSALHKLKSIHCDSPGCHINQARVWIDVDFPTRVAIQIPLIFGQQDIALDSQVDFSATHSTSAAYGQTIASAYGRFLKDASKWGTVVGCELRVNGHLRNAGGGAAGRVALFDKTADVQVTGAEIAEITSTTPTVMESVSFNWEDMTDGNEFELRTKNGNGVFADRLMIQRADLWLYVEPVTKLEVFIKLASKATAGSHGEYITKLEKSKFPTNTAWIYEVVGLRSSGTPLVELWDMGEVDETEAADTTPGTLITSLELTEATKERLRVAVTPVNNHRYVVRFSGGGLQFTSAFLIAQVPEQ